MRWAGGAHADVGFQCLCLNGHPCTGIGIPTPACATSAIQNQQTEHRASLQSFELASCWLQGQGGPGSGRGDQSHIWQPAISLRTPVCSSKRPRGGQKRAAQEGAGMEAGVPRGQAGAASSRRSPGDSLSCDLSWDMLEPFEVSPKAGFCQSCCWVVDRCSDKAQRSAALTRHTSLYGCVHA